MRDGLYVFQKNLSYQVLYEIISSLLMICIFIFQCKCHSLMEI